MIASSTRQTLDYILLATENLDTIVNMLFFLNTDISVNFWVKHKCITSESKFELSQYQMIFSIVIASLV